MIERLTPIKYLRGGIGAFGTALRRFERFGLRNSKCKSEQPHVSTAKKLSEKLWGGFSTYARVDLEELRGSAHARPEERSEASWHLARWFAFQGDFERAVYLVGFARDIDPSTLPNKDQILLEIDCLLRTDNVVSARTILSQELDRGYDPDIYLSYANAHIGSTAYPSGDAARLEWINRIYVEKGLMPLAKSDPLRPLTIDNLCATPRRSKPEDQPRVSVLVPAYNMEKSLSVALRGLLAQTWQNLEIIVVDDCSTDDTFSVAESFARQEPRVKAIRQMENQGTYAARNRGLEIATGELITTHDADDWSHPEKIEVQVLDFFGNRTAGCNRSFGVRVAHNLRFGVIPFRASKMMVHPSMVSTLFHRSAFDQCGTWDAVRIGADKEFIDRVRHAIGHKFDVLPQIPLTFSAEEARSLTRSDITHSVTAKHGVRREYNESAAHWRASSGSGNLRVDPSVRREFPAPALILPSRPAISQYDVLFIADFNRDCAVSCTMDHLRLMIAKGITLSIFQWPAYHSEVDQPLNPLVRQMAQAGLLRVVAAGEKVSTSTVIVGCPEILEHAIDLCPQLQFSNFIVIVDEVQEMHLGHDPITTARQNLRALFGTEGVWVSTSERVRQGMLTDTRYPPPYPEIWSAAGMLRANTDNM